MIYEDDENVVDSLPQRKQRARVEHNYYAGAVPVAAYVFGVPFTMILIALFAGADWASKTILAGLWPYLIGFFALLWVPCFFTVAWHVYKLRKANKQADEKHNNEVRLLKQQVQLSTQTNQLVQESRLAGDNIEIQFNDQGGLKSVKIIRAAVLVEQSRAGRVKQITEERANSAPAAIAERKQEEDETPIPIPQAPQFWDIIDLITEDEMPLCFIVDMNPRSPTFMQTIPAFGTILDLLSLCVIGRPGRGKSVMLLYYLCILARYGSEIHILDPQGAFKELMLLHGKLLPNMPATARIYYYSELAEMEKAVDNVMADIADRGEYYKPHMENGRFVKGGSTRHPLVVMADELPIIAEMDLEIKQRVREENKARKEDGLDALKIRQVTSMVKTSVLAARKYATYFIGVSQSIDASILPTRVTAGFNSRIIFSSTLRKATMAGLESEDGKRLLPVIKRAGPGKVIYDCGRWDDPLVAAFPNMTIADVLAYFGISMEELEALWIAELTAQEDASSDIDDTSVAAPHLQIVPARKAKKRATLADAIEVWNEQDTEIGRPRLRELLQDRGLECSDDLAKILLKGIKQQLDKAGGAGGQENEAV
jgi:hypothetical protein